MQMFYLFTLYLFLDNGFSQRSAPGTNKTKQDNKQQNAAGPFSEKWSYGAALFFSEFMPDVYFYDN